MKDTASYFLDPEYQDKIEKACKGLDINIFYPVGGEGVAEAKAICNKCTVKTECLKYALEYGENEGIWGGETERSRASMMKQLNIKAKPRPMVYTYTARRRY